LEEGNMQTASIMASSTDQYLGEITVAGEVVITDPCYEPGTWCQAERTVKPGKWHATAYIADGEGRVSALEILHSHDGNMGSWSRQPEDIGVDSGQLAFVAREYGSWWAGEYGSGQKPGYDEFCKITLTREMAGIVESGTAAVSSSGYGDGGYDLYQRKNKAGEIVGLMVVFIEPPQEDEEDDDDYSW
jgi:hypothetical protein